MSLAAEDRASSTRKAEVVPVALEPHPDADTLSVARAFGYACVVKTEAWAGVPLGAYIPPDSLVPVDRPEFAFLAPRAKADGKYRVKAQKIRGVVSFGLMVPAPPGAAEGDDVAAALGVEHYEPPLPGSGPSKGIYLGGEAAEAPHVWAPKYDLEAFRRFAADLFEPGEPVYVTEKLDGANARYVFWDGRMHCGSRTEWKREYPDTSHVTVEFLVAQGLAPDDAARRVAALARKQHRRNLWWEALANQPEVEAFCRAHPGVAVYGEIYGNVNAIKYGLPGPDRFAAFDVLADGKWLDPPAAYRTLAAWGVPIVPILNPPSPSGPDREPIPYDFDALCAMAEGPTLAADAKPGTIREGVVVSPAADRSHPKVGRVKLKLVSGDYLERYR